MTEDSSARLAVLIDADNANASLCTELMSEISKHGNATVRRAYGNWTTTNLQGWKEHLHKHAIQPIQQFSYTSGKNSTDSSLIIDAMDLLHGGNLEGFCIVSSDSDFTRLATRIRENGLSVIGFGQQKTPEAFIAACNRFVFLEVISKKPQDDSVSPKQGGKKYSKKELELLEILGMAIDAVSGDDGWSPLNRVGDNLNKNHPSFDPRNYGYQKLGQLVRRLDWIGVREVNRKDSSGAVFLYVRRKQDMMNEFDMVWERIESLQGETFRQIRGGEFTYGIDGTTLKPDRTNQNLRRSEFEKAFKFMPLKGTKEIQRLRGPSYLYAILMDKRVRISEA